MKRLSLLWLCMVASPCIAQDPPIHLTIKIHEGAGFFAELHKAVQTIIHYEDRGFADIFIDWTDEFFPYKDDPKENGWDLFFKPIQINKRSIDSRILPERIVVDSTASFHEMHDQVCTAPWVDYDRFLPYRQKVKEALDRYCKVQPHILAKVEDSYRKLMEGKIAIGVHARIARAHAWLVPGKRLPQLQDYFKEVDRLKKKHEEDEVVIFVASDSHAAIKAFKDRYGDEMVYIEAFRSELDQDPCTMYTKGAYMRAHRDVWDKEKHRYYGGLTTLMDCLMLAKCNYLIHTTSNLAFFSCYFNPELKNVYLPRAVPAKNCRFKNSPDIKNRSLNPD